MNNNNNTHTNQANYPNNNYQNNKTYTKSALLMAFSLGVIIGAGAYYLIGNVDFLNKYSRSSVNPDNSEKYIKSDNINNNVDDKKKLSKLELNKKNSTDNDVLVKDQPAGMKVRLKTVTLKENSWVAIREERDGALGNILGAQRFDAGTYKDTAVDLSRNTVERGVYYAVIYVDDGDKKFDYKKDILATNVLGEVIKYKFKAIRIR